MPLRGILIKAHCGIRKLVHLRVILSKVHRAHTQEGVAPSAKKAKRSAPVRRVSAEERANITLKMSFLLIVVYFYANTLEYSLDFIREGWFSALFWHA